jgi:hypothetical protein
MSRNYKQGIFTPTYPEKYRGDISKIIYRSSWELKFMQHCDRRSHIVEWASEEGFMIVPYMLQDIGSSETKMHRYFPDFWIKMKHIDENGENCFREILIEVKPFAETKPPRMPKKKNKAYYNRLSSFVKNQTKWKFARKVCKKKGWEFSILTEHTLLPDKFSHKSKNKSSDNS